MRNVAEEVKPLQRQHQELASRFPGAKLPGMPEVRRQALEKFSDVGFPTSKNELWKYTNLREIAGTQFTPAWTVPTASGVEVEKSLFPEVDRYQLVLQNGVFQPELSDIPASLRVMGLFEALKAGDVKALGQSSGPFGQLNTAFLQGGVYLELADGVVLDKPVELLTVQTEHDQAVSCHYRNRIVLGKESSLFLWENVMGRESQPYFNNAITEISVGESAVCEHVKLQRESLSAYHVARSQVTVEKHGKYTSHFFSLGGKLVRQEILARFEGQEAECHLNGLFLTDGGQHVDNHTVLDHAVPRCVSRELYKGVLNGKSSGVFDGKVLVREDAQHTDSAQTNRNLLLSSDAEVNTKPQLEIYADDVKCAHGATTGQLDLAQAFYLQSRGISRTEAIQILTMAFALEVADRITHEGVKNVVHQFVENWAPLDCHGQEAL